MGIDMQLIGEGCIVYGIVFVKGLRYGIAYPVPAHISLIGQDDGAEMGSTAVPLASWIFVKFSYNRPYGKNIGTTDYSIL